MTAQGEKIGGIVMNNSLRSFDIILFKEKSKSSHQQWRINALQNPEIRVCFQNFDSLISIQSHLLRISASQKLELINLSKMY